MRLLAKVQKVPPFASDVMQNRMVCGSGQKRAGCRAHENVSRLEELMPVRLEVPTTLLAMHDVTTSLKTSICYNGRSFGCNELAQPEIGACVPPTCYGWTFALSAKERTTLAPSTRLCAMASNSQTFVKKCQLLRRSVIRLQHRGLAASFRARVGREGGREGGRREAGRVAFGSIDGAMLVLPLVPFLLRGLCQGEGT